MSKFDNKKIMPRYSLIAILLTILACGVLAKTGYLMTVDREYWMKVASRVKRDSVPTKPMRGNIYSCDGKLLAGSLPKYRLYVDFKAIRDAKNDSLWEADLDSICLGLHDIFRSKSASEFRSDLEEGRAKQSRNWPVWSKRVDFNTYLEVKALPVFRLSSYRGGFHVEEFNARVNPFGSSANRTVGGIYAEKDTGRVGLELQYDSILRGKNGIITRQKVLNKWLSITDQAPVDGSDIVTTLDMSIQDLAEKAVVDKLKEIDGDVGVAIVMEVKTGDIKAIVNMDKCPDGEYRELKNHAVSDLLEPGSVFKPVSIMTVLEDGYCDTTKIVDTGGGVWPMYGRQMKDHNWRRGGYGTISLPRTLEVSSNIGVSRIIDEYYHNNPEKFVQGIYRTGIQEDFHLPLPGYSHAVIRMPKKAKNGQWLNWSNTALPWMSIGYETQIPPISTLTFYNAIANGGRMMKPRFVQRIEKDGQPIVEFPPEVVPGHEKICSDKVVRIMQTILTHVVSQGLGRKAGSPLFPVAGKTGTAQISQGAGGYKAGRTHYLISFAGFFPADNPRYSCIVCIQKPGPNASGGGMCGPVFRRIAEGIMARNVSLDVSDARDSSSVPVPEVKDGNIIAADYVLNHLGFKVRADWNGSYASGNPIWGKAQTKADKTIALKREKILGKSQVPDVTGMGARDAVYLLESRGVKVRLKGRGKVVSQSLPAGHKISKGQTCVLTLDI